MRKFEQVKESFHFLHLTAKGTKIIYEAAFQFNGVLAALDILVNDDNGWKAYEVKSSTSISVTYHMDATIQYYAITEFVGERI